MLEAISWFVICILTYLLDSYIFKKITNSKEKIFDVRNIFLILFMSWFSYFTSIHYTKVIKLVIANVQTCILLKLIFNKSFTKTLVITLFMFLMSAISEILFSIIFLIIFNIDSNLLLDNTLGSCISNIIILFIYFSIFQIKYFNAFLVWIIEFYRENYKIELGLLTLFILVLIASITYPISINNYSFQELLPFLLFFIATIYFVTTFFKQRSRNTELSVEYDHLLNYVKVYEKEVNEKSKSHHEYKNQLIIIRDMLKDKNKKAQKYISDLLEDSFSETDENLLKNLQYIPDGGLKGLIYFKLSALKEKKCQVHVLVDQILENKKLWKTCLDNLVDVSKIIGVFLDNAIEALEEEKEKYLIIDVEYEDKNLIFKISNSCTKHIESNKLDVEGYSTKGSKHGYGLPLVKDIVNNNPLLSNKREQNGKFFVQYLYIKQKK